MGADKDIVERANATADYLQESAELMPESMCARAYRELREAAAEIGRLRGEVEQLRVQLAGCGVIAMCNTRESLAKQMPERGAYGWSVSLEDCRNAVEREMALRERLESTAPAMPNGVEEIDWPFTYIVPDSKHEYVPKHHAERKIREALRAADNRDAAGVCATCNGVGMIGGHRGQTPDSFEQWAEDCPDCTPQPADVEAVAYIYQERYGHNDSAWVERINRSLPVWEHRNVVPLYAHPPAAQVQAAPQEGECASCETEGVFATDGSGPFDCYACGKKVAHPSACELGAVRELVARWRQRRESLIDRGRLGDGYRVASNNVKLCADELEAALQHRGDSKEVGRG